jgi:peroxiredoxin
MKRVNDHAPDFDLQDPHSAPVSLKKSLGKKPVIVALFKVGCPTCQYAFPFLERLHQKGVKVVGISQDSAKDTRDFANQFGVTFPVAIDAPGYTISKAYGITTVPSMFVVDEDGSIRYVTEGWVRKDFDELARIASGEAAPPVIFKSGESVLDFKAG